MSTRRVTRHHPLIVEFLQSKIQPSQPSESSECRLFDDDGSKYLLQLEQTSPDVIRLAVSLAGFTDYPGLSVNLAAVASDLQSKYQGVCRVVAGSGTCQLKVDILCDSLLSLDAEPRLTQLQNIASVRADALTWPLRQELKALQARTPSQSTIQVAYSKPGQPVLVRRSQEECQLVFPVWVPENSSKAYMTSFIQGFAEGRRLGASGDAPQCSYTSGPAPVPVPDHAQSEVSKATGGFVSIVVLPRHVRDDTLDDFAWRLLSFHDHVQYHVKCFQALIHSRMRKRMHSMILELEQAKTNAREALATININ